jgi:hypothetical protein
MRSRYIPFNLRRLPAEKICNICRLSAFVKVPLVGTGVDHRDADILVPEEFLDGSGIVAVFQQMGANEGRSRGSSLVC